MSKLNYEPPRLVRHQLGLMNKFGETHAVHPISHIDGVSVEDLAETYGRPVFVFSEAKLRARYRELKEELSRLYPRVRLAWSYKTNYLDAVCRIFHQEGAWAEVVSEFEYDKALRMGVPPEQIHFNGPYKSEAVLDRALSAGSMVHIEHFDELALAESVAKKRGIRPGVAIRVNLSAGDAPAWSRFGFNIENGQARDAVRRLMMGGQLDLVGLHCHLGTFILDPKMYRVAAGKMAAFANMLRSELGIKLQFIDLGGGMASKNHLKPHLNPQAHEPPSFARYAEAIAEGLAALDDSPASLPTLVMECGRALVDEAGYLVTSVLANKRMPTGQRAVVVDAGVNLLFTSFWYNHDIAPVRPTSTLMEPTVFYGPLCMNIDVVRDTVPFPSVNPGDLLVFSNVGAYNVTQWMQFITYRPAVVLVSPSKEHALMREPENLESILAHERVPSWL